MLRLILCAAIFIQIASSASLEKRQTVVDKGSHLLICKQEPIDLGIVLDSSSSVSDKDFKKGIKFLQTLLNKYQIGNGRNDVRTSIITFGKGIYPEQGFDLDTFSDKQDVINAVGKIQHQFGLYTSTGEAIEYMANTQMAKARPYAEKVSIVITDGNSQEWRKTRDNAKAARDKGIKIFAVGVGNVRDEELLRIAGNESRVIKVKNYSELSGIWKELVSKTCISKPKPTTTPPPPTECGEDYPGDINFVFSPAELGSDGTGWTTNFISLVVDSEDMKVGFRYGAITGSCPEDEGFYLNKYDDVEDIRNRLASYERYRMEELVERTITEGFHKKNGARDNAKNIAVLFVSPASEGDALQAEVDKLKAAGVRVFIANPLDLEVTVTGAQLLPGPGARMSANSFVSALCEEHNQ